VQLCNGLLQLARSLIFIQKYSITSTSSIQFVTKSLSMQQANLRRINGTFYTQYSTRAFIPSDTMTSTPRRHLCTLFHLHKAHAKQVNLHVIAIQGVVLCSEQVFRTFLTRLKTPHPEACPPYPPSPLRAPCRPRTLWWVLVGGWVGGWAGGCGRRDRSLQTSMTRPWGCGCR
jgi:hypothetical protein